jgi:malate permease and related proteins
VNTTNSTFLISLLVILLGYLIKKLNVVKPEDGKVLSRIVLFVTFPALILHTLARLQINFSFLLLPLICLLFGLGVFLFSYAMFRHKPPAVKGLLLMAVVGFNIGLFAYPIVEAIWGLPGLQYLAMFDIGNAILVLGLSYGVGSVYAPKFQGQGKVNIWRITRMLMRSIPLLAYVLGLGMNIGGLAFPPVLAEFIGVLARANMALVLLLLGIYLNLRFEKEILKQVAIILLIRYGFGLAAGFALYYLLPFDPVYRSVLLIGLILPVGLTIIPFSDEFSYSPGFAGAMANISIIVSFVLMWGLITFMKLA